MPEQLYCNGKVIFCITICLHPHSRWVSVSGISIFRNAKNYNALNRLKPTQKKTVPSGDALFFCSAFPYFFLYSYKISCFFLTAVPGGIFRIFTLSPRASSVLPSPVGSFGKGWCGYRIRLPRPDLAACRQEKRIPPDSVHSDPAKAGR